MSHCWWPICDFFSPAQSFCGKSVIRWLLNTQPHLNCISTLTWNFLNGKIFGDDSYYGQKFAAYFLSHPVTFLIINDVFLACALVVPAFAYCQFPVYLWQSLSTTWWSRFQHQAGQHPAGGSAGGQQQKRWTSWTLYPAGDSINWTSRREVDVMSTRLTIKAVTKAVCFDSNTNSSVVCDRKDVLYRVDCLSARHNDIYRVQIHGAGQVTLALGRTV